MKKVILMLLSLSSILIACHSPKKTVTTTPAPPETPVVTQNPVPTPNEKDIPSLTGEWELDHVPNPAGTFEQLYPGRKPTIIFNESEGNFSGYSGCNTFHGKMAKNGDKMNFKENMMMTKMACQGDGEKIFLKNLEKINHYAISKDGKELTFIQGDMELMHFHRK